MSDKAQVNSVQTLKAPLCHDMPYEFPKPTTVSTAHYIIKLQPSFHKLDVHATCEYDNKYRTKCTLIYFHQ